METPPIEKLEKRVKQIENTLSDWQDWKFITRDSSHKIGVAQGLASTLQNEVLEMKVNIAHIARTVDTVLERQIEVEDKIETLHKDLNDKFDTIISLLKPEK